MLIVCAPTNGVGLGHLSRTLRVCEALAAIGHHPVIFSQGYYARHHYADVPGTSMKSLAIIDPADRLRRLASYLRLSSPSCLFEDTYPVLPSIGHKTSRFLIVRPAQFETMQFLRYEFSNHFRRYLVADSPESPTWPYSPEETVELCSWRNWECVGPIFRTYRADRLRIVKDKYRIKEGTPVFVFTMGGGGCSRGSDDVGVSMCRYGEGSKS